MRIANSEGRCPLVPTYPEPPDGVLAEAEALVHQLIDGEMTPAALAQLDHLVCTHPAVCRLYLAHIQLHRTLPRYIAPQAMIQQAVDLSSAMILPALVEPDVEDDGPPQGLDGPAMVGTVVPTAARRWDRTRVRWAAAVLLPLMVAVGIWVGRSTRPSRPPLAKAGPAPAVPAPRPAPSGDRLATGVATAAVVRVGAVVRADLRRADGSPVTVGQTLGADPVRLWSGWARIDFPHGATAVVEAPATVRVVSGSEMALLSGRVAATVPQDARGFTVTAAACRVVDLGTEFGVAVDPNGRTDVAVLRGVVTFDRTARPTTGPTAAPAPPGVRLTQGQGRRMASTTAPAVAVAVAPAQFVRAEQFDRWARASTETAASADGVRAAAEQLCRDPSLVLYYSFADRSTDGPNRILNRADATAGRYDLTVAGPHAPNWADGRLPSLSALSFDPAAQQRLLVPNWPAPRTGQLSCAAWVYCRTRSSWATVAKNWGDSRGGALHFGLYGSDGDLEVELDGATPGGTKLREGASHPFPTGRWVHVAFTTDGAVARLYRDGRVVAEGPSRPLPPTEPFRSLAIAFKTDDSGVNPSSAIAVGYWNGLMGDLAVFDRALSADEVRRLADVGRPR